MSFLTTLPIVSLPVNPVAGTTPTWGSWTQAIASTSANTVIAGLSYSVGTYTDVRIEADFGIGPAGAEQSIGTLRMYAVTNATQGGFTDRMLAVPLGGLPTGARLSLRLRTSSGSAAPTKFHVLYYVGLPSDQATAATHLLASAPSGASTASLTPNATPWAYTAWTQLIASAPSSLLITGLAHSTILANSGIEWELGTGGSGSETTITTIRTATALSQMPWSPLPAPYPIATGTRLSVRLRKSGTTTTPVDVSVIYYDNLAPVPGVVSIFPTSGRHTGGAAITITGFGFSTGATVTIGGVACTSVVVVSPQTITAFTGAHATGAVDIVVTNQDTSTSTLAGGYTYLLRPLVTGVSPNLGLVTGGTPINIVGTDFITGATVLVGDLPATSVVWVSATQMTAVTPAHAVGFANVAVANPTGLTSTLVSAFEYRTTPPVITALTPATGVSAGGETVVITGSGFVTGLTVKFGPLSATVAAVSPTSITVFTPSFLDGLVSVTVTNPSMLGETTVENAFTFGTPPTLTSSTPATGRYPDVITLTGTNFVNGAFVYIDGVASPTVGWSSSTSMTAIVPNHIAGLVAVEVRNPNGQTGRLADAFTYLAPTPVIVSINPLTGPSTGRTPITIFGANFIGGLTVTLGGVNCTNIIRVAEYLITAVSPAHPIGAVDVVVTNPDTYNDTLASGYLYVLPAVEAAPIAPVAITGALYQPNGVKLEAGRLTIVPQDIITDGSELVGRTPVLIDITGDLSFSLMPSHGVLYDVTFEPDPNSATPGALQTGYFKTTWLVPDTGPVDINDL